MAKKNNNNTQLSKKQAEKAERIKRAKRKKLIKALITVGVLVAIVAITLTVVLVVKNCKENPEVEKTYATISFGDYGSVVVRLDEENAPQTVKHFKKLASTGKYNGLELTSATNGCLYTDYEQNWATIFGEFFRNGVNNNLSHKKGVISMNREADKNSGNGTFFFTLEDKSETLDKEYAAFGEITSGMDILAKIAEDVAENDGSSDYPTITSIRLETKKERVK